MATEGSLSARQLAKLKRKAKRNDVEVEDLLAVATCGDSAAITVLQELQKTYQWSESDRVGHGRVAPLGRWAKVVCRYLRDGTQGMADLALADDEPELDREMAISVLEEIKTADSVRALIRVTGTMKLTTAKGRARALDIVAAFNMILSFYRGNDLALDEGEVKAIRAFVHCFLDVATTENEISTAYCALRAVGNEESLARIQIRPPLRRAFKGVEEIVCKAIKRNIRRHG
jgi:hypothetical protein